MDVVFGGLELDELGRVVLSDADLMAIDDLGLVSAGGTDGQTNSGTCTNSASCAGSTNGQCTNAQGACSRASNTGRCVEGPKQMEIEMEG